MFLTKVLHFYKKYKKVPGLLTAGKHRALPHISLSLKKKAVRWLMLEQENLEILSRPYLTEEEAAKSTKAKREQNNFVQRMALQRQMKMLPHRTAKDIFTLLYKQRSWE